MFAEVKKKHAQSKTNSNAKRLESLADENKTIVLTNSQQVETSSPKAQAEAP